MIKKECLYLADLATGSKNVKNGSYQYTVDLKKAASTDPDNREIFFDVCKQLNLKQRESYGECITCEAYRAVTKKDLFYKGQVLFRLECNHDRTNYRMLYKLIYKLLISVFH